ncbi:MAG: hypothetical protein J6R12_09060 [Bacteroidales bacterium]|nr:hypothetical protein [Bacteroidales bacterium]
MEKILQHIEALQERLQSLSEEMALVRLQLDDLKLLCQAAFEPSLETPEVSQEDAMIIGAELAATALLIDDKFSEEESLDESEAESLEVADEESLEESVTESLEALANEVPDSYEDAPVFTDDDANDAPDFDADEISDVANEISDVEEEEAVDEMVSENPVMDEAVEAEASDGEPNPKADFEIEAKLEIEAESAIDPEAAADPEIDPEIESYPEIEAEIETAVVAGIETTEPEPEIEAEPASETLADVLNHERPDSLAERYEKQLAQKRLQNTLAAQRYADFSRALSLNDRFRYQRELFNNNREALSQLLAALDSMETWAEAEDYLSSYQWDEELPVVQEFYAMIEQHFNQ